ncbi:MAG TPA: triose-phosphate isomerase [Candidatus Paceibacterota bacterium]|nr:triose-phosphate isomerase [Candidatus Paceibacterota bacterium]
MSNKIIVGNWKMNPVTLKDAKLTFGGIKRSLSKVRGVSVLICPPYVYLSELKKLVTGGKLEIGAQDNHYQDQGAQTGGISAYMIRDLGIKTVIIGHSERRASGDTDEIINKKVLTALTAGLRVILCLGEKVRDEKCHYLDVLQDQLVKDLAGFPVKLADRLIVAYEPVWAIGKDATGVETPEGFLHNKIFIRKILTDIIGRKKAMAVPVLYGGSANAQNAGDFLGAGQADGLLVGRDSLNPKNFVEIIKIASKS